MILKNKINQSIKKKYYIYETITQVSNFSEKFILFLNLLLLSFRKGFIASPLRLMPVFYKL